MRATIRSNLATSTLVQPSNDPADPLVHLAPSIVKSMLPVSYQHVLRMFSMEIL